MKKILLAGVLICIAGTAQADPIQQWRQEQVQRDIRDSLWEIERSLRGPALQPVQHFDPISPPWEQPAASPLQYQPDPTRWARDYQNTDPVPEPEPREWEFDTQDDGKPFQGWNPDW